jgi:hypothetical protein
MTKAEFDLMAGNVVQLRDFKRREEAEAADVRLAKQVMGSVDGPWDALHADTAPAEYSAPTEDAG